MNTTLDGEKLFDEQDLKVHIGPWRRASIERAISGLDGMVSIDLGRRDRRIRQRGILHTASRAALQSRVASIQSFQDGRTHTLVTAEGQKYTELRMDTFEAREGEVDGVSAAMAYEIVYTQLGSE